MASVYAVEVADGQRAGAPLGARRKAMKNVHRSIAASARESVSESRIIG